MLPRSTLDARVMEFADDPDGLQHVRRRGPRAQKAVRLGQDGSEVEVDLRITFAEQSVEPPCRHCRTALQQPAFRKDECSRAVRADPCPAFPLLSKPETRGPETIQKRGVSFAARRMDRGDQDDVVYFIGLTGARDHGQPATGVDRPAVFGHMGADERLRPASL